MKYTYVETSHNEPVRGRVIVYLALERSWDISYWHRNLSVFVLTFRHHGLPPTVKTGLQ